MSGLNDAEGGALPESPDTDSDYGSNDSHNSEDETLLDND
jgi:hypothetical protein